MFMLAGPASNIATIGVVNKLINRRAAIIYTLGVSILSVLSGVALNFIIDLYNLDVTGQINNTRIVPLPIAIALTAFVFLASVKPLRPYLGLVHRQKA